MAKKQLNEDSRQPTETVAPELPPGVKLVRTLRGHTGTIGRIAWSPDGRLLASPSADKTIRLWDTETGECLRTLKGHEGITISVAFDPAGHTLASGSSRKVRLWEVDSGRLLHEMEEHGGLIWSVAFDPAGHTLASGSQDLTVKVWKADGRRSLQTLKGHEQWICSVAFDPADHTLASGSADNTVKLWEPGSGRLLRSLEGHTQLVNYLEYSSDGRLLASKGFDTIRLWQSEIGTCISVIPETGSLPNYSASLTFHPHLPLLATVGSEPGTPENERDQIIHIYELDIAVLLGQASAIQTSHYVNAKAMLLGDTGVGKSGLSLVLNDQPFIATDSTPGRKVWTFQSEEVELDGHRKQTRETLLWDLAGQPGYRVIHQLHLNEVAVALVVFDARSNVRERRACR